MYAHAAGMAERTAARIAQSIAVTLGQESESDVSGGTALVAFFVVMGIVIIALAVVRQRRSVGTDAGREEAMREEEAARRVSFEEKMRRVEQRLREAAAADAGSTGDAATGSTASDASDADSTPSD